MKIQNIRRRDFFKTLAGGAGGVAAASLLGNPSLNAAAPLKKAQESIDDLRITEIKFMRLAFPGRTKHRWNSIIDSPSVQPDMNLVELHTNQGIVGRGIRKGSKDIMLHRLFPRIKGENPFFVERIWDRMYRHNRKPVAKGDYIRAMGTIDLVIWDPDRQGARFAGLQGPGGL